MLVKLLSRLEHNGVSYKPSSELQSVKGLSREQAERLAEKRVIAPDFKDEEKTPADLNGKKKDKE